VRLSATVGVIGQGRLVFVQRFVQRKEGFAGGVKIELESDRIPTNATGLLPKGRSNALGGNDDAISLMWGSMLDQGVWAEVKVGGEYLKLFSEQSPLGVQASVYNANAKNWVAPSEAVDDIEQARTEQQHTLRTICVASPTRNCLS
jgi:hypothetical protein